MAASLVLPYDESVEILLQCCRLVKITQVTQKTLAHPLPETLSKSFLVLMVSGWIVTA